MCCIVQRLTVSSLGEGLHEHRLQRHFLRQHALAADDVDQCRVVFLPLPNEEGEANCRYEERQQKGESEDTKPVYGSHWCREI